MADAFGVKFEDVEALHGDTAISAQGLDTYGSRSLAAGGVAVQKAAEKIIGNMSSYQAPSAAELPSFVTDHVITPVHQEPG